MSSPPPAYRRPRDSGRDYYEEEEESPRQRPRRRPRSPPSPQQDPSPRRRRRSPDSANDHQYHPRRHAEQEEQDEYERRRPRERRHRRRPSYSVSPRPRQRRRHRRQRSTNSSESLSTSSFSSSSNQRAQDAHGGGREEDYRRRRRQGRHERAPAPPHRRYPSPRTARRVSNDEEELHPPQHVQQPSHQPTHPRHHQSRRHREEPSPPPRPRHADTNNDDNKQPNEDDHTSTHDDTVGHFVGDRGTLVADRYRILHEVGLGTFGRVWACVDEGRRPSRPGQPRGGREGSRPVYAMKIVRKVQRYYESAVVEARIINNVNRRGGRGRTHCVVLHDSFTFQGHYCMVFESLGPSLFDFLKKHNYQPFPMVCVQDFTVQLLETMEFLHSFGLIHTDLKIENILLMNDREIAFDRYTQVPERTKIKLIDFGGACYDDDTKKSRIINTRQYRAPEVILEMGWSMPSDMWSLGCILVELYQGELLFPTHSNVEHLALMEHVVNNGRPFPRRMLQAARARDLVDQAFDYDTGRHRRDRVLSASHADFVRQAPTLPEIFTSGDRGHQSRHYDNRDRRGRDDNPEDDWWLSRLLQRHLLVLDPHDRSTAHECLQYLQHVRRREVRYA